MSAFDEEAFSDESEMEDEGIHVAAKAWLHAHAAWHRVSPLAAFSRTTDLCLAAGCASAKRAPWSDYFCPYHAGILRAGGEMWRPSADVGAVAAFPVPPRGVVALQPRAEPSKIRVSSGASADEAAAVGVELHPILQSALSKARGAPRSIPNVRDATLEFTIFIDGRESRLLFRALVATRAIDAGETLVPH
jgi:hypothetical protein